MTSDGMEVSAFRGGPSANISPSGLDRKGEEPDGREHERALVRRAQDGDRDAFGELYRIHLPAVARLVRFRVGRDDEDTVSEVFLRAWRGLASYRETGVPFAAWLYGIARHVAIDELRRQGRVEARHELPDRAFEPMTAEVLTLRGAIDELPTEQRQVIELKYLVGMTNEEVAAAMATTPGAVNARQWRALKSLAEILEERS
jgi:RNA polymerase sigma-70 factor (ECF subfamily)